MTMNLVLNNFKGINFTVITIHDDGSKTWSVPHTKIETALDHKNQIRRGLYGLVQRVNVKDILVVERTTSINEKIVG